MLASIGTGRVRIAALGLAAALAVGPGLLPTVAPRGHACSYPAFPVVADLPGCVPYARSLPQTIPANTVFYAAPTIDGVPLPLNPDGTITGAEALPAPRTITTSCGQTTLSLDTDALAPDAPAVAAATNHRVPEPGLFDCGTTRGCDGVDSYSIELMEGHDDLTPAASLTYLVYTGDDPTAVGGPDDVPVVETVSSHGTLSGYGLLDDYVAVRAMDFAGHVSERSNVFRVNR